MRNVSKLVEFKNEWKRSYWDTQIVCLACKAVLITRNEQCKSYSYLSEAEQVLVRKHLTEKHDRVACPHCSDLVSSKGMKKHQRGSDCELSQRENFFLTEDKVLDDENVLSLAIYVWKEQKLEEALKHTYWNDPESCSNALILLDGATRQLEKKLGVTYSTRRNGSKTELAVYLPSLTRTFLKELHTVSLRRYAYGDKARLEWICTTLENFANADLTTRESILCILELQNEGTQ